MCASCDKSCYTCSGASASTCLSCPANSNRDNLATASNVFYYSFFKNKNIKTMPTELSL